MRKEGERERRVRGEIWSGVEWRQMFWRGEERDEDRGGETRGLRGRDKRREVGRGGHKERGERGGERGELEKKTRD